MSCKNHKKGYKLALINKNNMKFNIVKGLVSIITPCYNSAGYIHRLLDSILMQDYPMIEMFAVDDGSTDNTKEVLESYIPKFEDKGYTLTYIFQKNAGQSAAVNRGLKLITGEFLTWPDSDDYYTREDAISIFVKELQSHNKSYGAVCHIGTFVNEKNHTDIVWRFNGNLCEDLFITYLTGEGVIEVPINYMVRVRALDSVIFSRDIFTGRQPQNLQLLLPLFYSYKCHTYRESLSNIVVRPNSHSHLIKSYERQLDDIQGYIDIWSNTLSRMSCLSKSELEKYLHIVNLRFLNDKLTLALNFDRCKDARRFAQKLKKMGGTLSQGKRLKLFLSFFPPALKMAKWLQKNL